MPGTGWSTDETAAAVAPAHVNSIMCTQNSCEKQPCHSLRALCIPTSALKRISALQLMQEILPKDSIPYEGNVYIPSWRERKILGCSQTYHQFLFNISSICQGTFWVSSDKNICRLTFYKATSTAQKQYNLLCKTNQPNLHTARKTTLGISFWSNWQPQEGKNANNPKIQSVTRRCLF